MARAINSEIKAGRGSPHGGVFLDIASRRDADYIKRRLPSMYHQFKELADVDITAEAMEIGPTCHYVMGGVEVDPDTEASIVPGLYAAGEVAGGMHGSNRLGGNSLSDLLVFGRRAGENAAEYATKAEQGRPAGADEPAVDAAAEAALAPFSIEGGGENAYTLQKRPAGDRCRSWSGSSAPTRSCARRSEMLRGLEDRATRLKVERRTGEYNPGWHLALDLTNMLLVSECIAHRRPRAHRVARRAHPRGLPRRPTTRGARST